MHETFLSWLYEWYEGLPEQSFAGLDVVPRHTAVASIDMINGFCKTGPLASPEVEAIIPSVTSFLQKSHAAGVRDFLLVQDAHSNNAEEFGAYPPHAQEGSQEAQTVDEIAALPFANLFKRIHKNSLSPAYGTVFSRWMRDHKRLESFILVGNCTDLCIYTMAMHLKLSANDADMKRRIIIPADCVATYDMTVATAKLVGALPHDAELLHKLFLYHLSLNGIEVVARIGR